MPATGTNDRTFPANWSAEILSAPPLIAPARQYTLPFPVPGEEDALARGALQIVVKPAPAGPLWAPAGQFLATCALGFRDPSLPSGLWSTAAPDTLLAVAGGYGYLVPTAAPEATTHLHPRPITAVLPAPEAGLILLAGFHDVTAIGPAGTLWQTARLTWEGISMQGIRDGQLHGTGWNMQSDRDIPFTVDLQTGQHTGGGFP